MDVVGSEIGQKMRSAIKAKLTELGCYVDDELPDYVMVMVANKRTRAQMEEDLQLFLGDNTLLFVNWLHQVLRKLQEVTVTPPVKVAEPPATSKDRSSSKDRKSKEKKDKSKEKHKKGESSKKSKKKLKEKQRKKGEKKAHKKKKSKEKDTAIKRPNIPPLLMNMEKDSEPSITDVFAGQILKNHGITLDVLKEDAKIPDVKPLITELKRPILPIIDPATISTEPTAAVAEVHKTAENANSSQDDDEVISIVEPINNESEETTEDTQIKEINEIEAKIQGLKQKLAEQLDSMSDDDDFLNIRTEAEELMNDFAEDILQETSSSNPPNPLSTESPAALKAPSPLPSEAPKPITPPAMPKEPEVLPQIELNLPKRPVRDRLGARSETTKAIETKPDRKKSNDRRDSPERFTPEREPDFWGKGKSVKSRLGDQQEGRKSTGSEVLVEHKTEPSTCRRLTSRVSVLESREGRAGPASVVRVRPRPRAATAAPASNLLLRAVADANKSLRNIPPKLESEPMSVKRALVLPMRRANDAHKIVIRVQSTPAPSSGGASDCEIDFDTESLAELEGDHDIRVTKDNRERSQAEADGEYIPKAITKRFLNTDYVPSQRSGVGADVDETLIVETINIHKSSTKKEKEKGPTFVVTLDGLDPNIFLAKKLKTEGILDEETHMKPPEPVDKPQATTTQMKQTEEHKETSPKTDSVKIAPPTIEKKRLSDTSEDSDTQVIIEAIEVSASTVVDKRKSAEISTQVSPPPVKKRKASPIVFDVESKKEKERERVRERTESTGSDSHVTVTTTTSTNKYDALPSLSQAERKLLPCRAFPLCRFGSSCAFAHPPCKFAAGCTRRGCVYSHPAATPATPPARSVASQVVPVGNFKSITSSTIPNMCKFYPDCANPGCHYYHPKPCRYGKACANRLHCNFYHHDQPNKWRVS